MKMSFHQGIRNFFFSFKKCAKSETTFPRPSVLMIYVCLFQHVQNDPPNAKGLAQLILQVIQFQEDSLGKSAKNPPFPRLPVSFLIFYQSIFQNMIISCCKNHNPEFFLTGTSFFGFYPWWSIMSYFVYYASVQKWTRMETFWL